MTVIFCMMLDLPPTLRFLGDWIGKNIGSLGGIETFWCQVNEEISGGKIGCQPEEPIGGLFCPSSALGLLAQSF